METAVSVTFHWQQKYDGPSYLLITPVTESQNDNIGHTFITKGWRGF